MCAVLSKTCCLIEVAVPNIKLIKCVNYRENNLVTMLHTRTRTVPMHLQWCSNLKSL